MWSTKEINIVKIPFIFQNFKTFLSTSSPSTTEKTYSSAMGVKEMLENTANSLGFTLIPIAGNCNCFFTAVAFQLQPILMARCCPENLHIHLQSLGINNQLNVEELSVRL